MAIAKNIEELSRALTGTWIEGSVDLTNGFFRQDVTEPDDPKDNWTVFCDIQEILREHGWEIEDPYIEHDCISGKLKARDDVREVPAAQEQPSACDSQPNS